MPHLENFHISLLSSYILLANGWALRFHPSIISSMISRDSIIEYIAAHSTIFPGPHPRAPPCPVTAHSQIAEMIRKRSRKAAQKAEKLYTAEDDGNQRTNSNKTSKNLIYFSACDVYQHARGGSQWLLEGVSHSQYSV